MSVAEGVRDFRNFWLSIIFTMKTLIRLKILGEILNSCPRNRRILNEASNALHNTDDINFTNTSEIHDCIRNLGSEKSSGSDNLSNFLLKKSPPSSMEFLVVIFNNCLNNGY